MTSTERTASTDEQTDTTTASDPSTAEGAGANEHENSERRTDTVESSALEECPECDGTLVADEARGETVCEDCGLVVDDDAIDTGPEWRAFEPDERDRKSRVGAPMTNTKHDKGLSTSIGWKNEDAYGTPLDERKRRRISRLRTWDERFSARDSADRNLKLALGEIDRMASATGLPDSTRETASVLYRRALEEELLPGRSIEAMATAALYAAARTANIPRSIDEVAAVSRVDQLEIERAYRYVIRELDLAIPPSNPADFLGRYASELDCSSETERLARDLVDDAVDAGVHSGRHPVGIAAAAIYAAGRLTNESLTQDDISAVANVSNVTIRNRYVEILDAAEGDTVPA